MFALSYLSYDVKVNLWNFRAIMPMQVLRMMVCYSATQIPIVNRYTIEVCLVRTGMLLENGYLIFCTLDTYLHCRHILNVHCALPRL